MNLRILFFGLLLLAAVVCRGQDFEPGEQAQGYLDGKHVTVDHCTGIFHYKVPLYTLKSGDYELPVSLDYAAKGVKVEDDRGLVGYNWTLNTGGVVTRTIRGGIADEDRRRGYLVTNLPGSVSVADDVDGVNKRERDGECDIFTAVFNGRSLDFILRMDADKQIYAEPLERSQVRLECETDVQSTITGWIVTDEGGNRYVYRQCGWSSDIVSDEAVSFNGVRGESYISSWYLSRIEPYNGRPVVYYYREDVKPKGEQQGIRISRESMSFKSKYTYGSTIYERPFDFSKYKEDFESHINSARSYMEGFSWEQQLNNSLYEFDQSGQWIRNPNFEAGLQSINANFRVMGMLADFRNVCGASNELIQILNELYTMYAEQSSFNASMAASYLKLAKDDVIRCLDEVCPVTKNETGGGYGLVLRTPILELIVCGERKVRFYNDAVNSDYRLLGIRLCDGGNKRISEIRLDEYSDLSKLVFLGRDSVEMSRLVFDYYRKPSGSRAIVDVWGFYKESDATDYNKYWPDVNGDFAKINSLKSISLPDGGKIEIDYESNQYNYPNNQLMVEHGGIRLKSLVFKDKEDVAGDTLRYLYPLPGVSVYPFPDNQEDVVSYGSFTDYVIHNRLKQRNTVALNMGNNGLHYPYVQEVRPGQGMRAYFFDAVMVFPDLTLPNINSFWRNGLPLAVADYDEDGHLLRLSRKHYKTDLVTLQLWSAFLLNESFFSDGTLRYDKYLPQRRAYEYYIDADRVEEYYREQGNVFLYSDGNASCYLSPYHEVYLRNIEPRTCVQTPSDCLYGLYYGGSVLLAEESVYEFEGVEGELSEFDFGRQNEGVLLEKRVYHYDRLPESLQPTRVETTDSRGDCRVEVMTRVGDFTDGADEAVDWMKERNAVNQVVKRALLRNGLLEEEQVSVYGMQQSDSVEFACVTEEYVYRPAGECSYALSMPEDDLFSYEQGVYRRMSEREYAYFKGMFLPCGFADRSSGSAFCYDAGEGLRILEALQVSHEEVDAVDLKRGEERFSEEYFHLISCFRHFYDALPFIEANADFSFDEQGYWESVENDRVTKLMEVIATYDDSKHDDLQELYQFVMEDNTILDDFETYYQYPWIWMPAEEYFNPSLLAIALNALRDGVVLSSDFLDVAGSYDLLKSEQGHKEGRVVVPASGRMQLYVLHKGYASVNCGRESAYTGWSADYSVKVFDFDFTPGSTVTFETNSMDEVAYLALVPAGTVFEAVCYQADGSVFATFDQTGRLRVNEYDAAGRLVRVRDGRGQVVSEYEYNQAGL